MSFCSIWNVHAIPTYTCKVYQLYDTRSRLAIIVLNYCMPRINAKRLNYVMLIEARWLNYIYYEC